jgi:Protein of unknown function (DUF2817)
MSYANAFSFDYVNARTRFLSCAQELKYRLHQYPIDETGPNGEDLTIDVAILGESHPKKAVIISSGIHGVEGFFGSAVQLALLENFLYNWSPPSGCSLILIHALNPYGFAKRRRVNEDNVDLNRNFLLPNEEYRGSPEKYKDLNTFFNPASPPSSFEPFFLKVLVLIARYGMARLNNTLPVGQYDFPLGLFFGGDKPSKTYRILEANLPLWIGNATDVIHLDFHTGLGQKATYKLYLEEPIYSKRYEWLAEKFGTDVVEAQASIPGSSNYSMRGSLGKWCKAKFPHCNYNFLIAEFGTYNLLRVVEALRAENRAHWWGKQDDSYFERAKQRLVEVFAPAEASWREVVVSQGISLVQKAIEVCFLG